MTIYVSALAANGNALASGDQTYGAQYTLAVSKAADITITSPKTLPVATAFAPYSFKFTATGGSGNYYWSIYSGRLPSDIEITGGYLILRDGTLSGTPHFAGTYTFEVFCSDGLDAGSRYVIGQFTITVLADNILPISIPNTNFSSIQAINKQGDVVGTAGVSGIGLGYWSRPVLRTGSGVVLYFDLDGTIYGMNEYRDLVGQYGSPSRGFLREWNGAFTSIDPPGARGDAAVLGINKQRQLAGYYFNGSKYVAFIRSPDGTFTPELCTGIRDRRNG
ncbi:MAG: hypothetical protein HY820_18485 [Acidobacteria bacterium]|nr:hypothetical protein [Acidobacteriota bacterium]